MKLSDIQVDASTIVWFVIALLALHGRHIYKEGVYDEKIGWLEDQILELNAMKQESFKRTLFNDQGQHKRQQEGP